MYLVTTVLGTFMSFVDYLEFRAIALCALAFFGTFFYRLITGRSLAEVLRELRTPKDQQGQENRANRLTGQARK